jgi:hypothetical protein
MIGLMKCTIGGTEAGAIKSASVTVKPQYKEHKSGYPPVTDFKSLIVAEGVCKVDAEENTLSGTLQKHIDAIVAFAPVACNFSGKAPGWGGVACTISGSGFSSGGAAYGKMEDFGYVGVEGTCTSLSFTGAGAAPSSGLVGGVPFVVPDAAAQVKCSDVNSLLYGAPSVDGKLCQSAQLQISSKVRYLVLKMDATTLDCAVMESCDGSITGFFAEGNSVTSVSDSMKTGFKPDAHLSSISISIPTVGGSTGGASMNAFMDADVTFNPGNDWNGVGVKYTYMKSKA